MPSGDQSIGNFLGDVASIFDSAVDDSGKAQATQTDRDREGMSQIAGDLERLNVLKNNGDISGSEFTARKRNIMKDAFVQFPGKQKDILGLAGVITGQAEEEPLVDVGTAIINSAVEQGTNGSNPLLSAALSASLVIDQYGQPDNQATLDTYMSKVAQYQFELAETTKITNATARLVAENKMTEEVQNGATEQFALFANQHAQNTVDGILSGFQAGVDDPDAYTKVLIELDRAHSQLSTEFTRKALEGGFLDNYEAKFKGGMDAALAPITNFKAFLLSVGEDQAKGLAQAMLEDRLALANALKKAGANIGQMDAEFYQSSITERQLGKIRAGVDGIDAAAALQPNLVKLAMGNGDPRAPNTEIHESDGSGVTPAAKVVMAALPPEQAQSEVKRSLSTWGGLASFDAPTPAQVTHGVNGFVEATEVINQRGVPIDEATFDAIYNSDFWGQYDKVQKGGGENSTRIETAAATNLTTILVNREAQVVETTRQEFGEFFPNMNVEFNGTGYELTLSAITANEKAVVKSLDSFNLPHTGEGLMQLDRILKNPANTQIVNNKVGDGPQVTSLGGFKLTTEFIQFENVIKGVAYLNKIVSNIGKLPEGVRLDALPTGAIKRIQVTNEEEFDSLKPGQAYRAQVDDWYHTGVR